MSFTYNDEGIRTSKNANGVKHSYSLNGSQIIMEDMGGSVLVYLYDASGNPIGMQYRNTLYDMGAYDNFWFEKNLQGDIVAVYNAAGTKLISYTYDAWGNFTTTYHNGCTASHNANLNPFRYRGYYYDAETGLYYLQSRYYDPVIGRFINADSITYLGADGTPLSYNIYAYCKNNPVMGYDPTGCVDWSTFWDVTVTVFAGLCGIANGIATANRTIDPRDKLSAGIAAGVTTFGTINNVANAIYFNYFSDGESNLETTNVGLPYHEKRSDYVEGYINRWDRLDYAKHITKSEIYDMNAWRSYSEYSLHMHLWNAVEPFQGKDIWLADRIGKSAIHAHIDPYAPDPDWKIHALTIAVGILGL